MRADERRTALDLVLHLVAREFRVRYTRSSLGYLWAVVQPLARLLVLSFIFTRLVQQNVEDYSLYLFVGLLGWQWFSNATASATRSVLVRRELVVRPGVPRFVVPVVSVLTDGLDYAASLPVLAVFLAVEGELHATALLLPVTLLPMVLLATGLGFALCAVNVYVRDVARLVDLALLLGFYVTPVFYTTDALPQGAADLIAANPIAWALDAQRRVVLEGTWPDWSTFGALVAVGAAVLAIGIAIYGRTSRTLVDEL